MAMKSVIIQNILESIPIGLLVINPRGEIVTTNCAASTILGYPVETLEGKGWGELFFFTDQNRDFNQVIIDVIWGRRVNLHREVSYIKLDGETLQVSMTTSFLMEGDEMAGIVVLIDDVTDLFRLHEREKANLEEKSRIQRERAESLKKLALAVAHQIRNPISIIGGFALRLLKGKSKESPEAAYLQHIMNGTLRLENIVKAVQEYADLPGAVPEKVRFAEVLRQSRENVNKKIAGLSPKMTWRVDMNDITFTVDPGLFVKALDEILLNAMESFHDGEGAIEVQAYRTGHHLRIEIRDNGKGITESDLPFIFDPLFTTKPVGVGMGLCKAQRIIKEHKGDIYAESRQGGGTTVAIQLPNDNA